VILVWNDFILSNELIPCPKSPTKLIMKHFSKAVLITDRSEGLMQYFLSHAEISSQKFPTEHRGRVVNTPSYSGCPGFDSRSRQPPILIDDFRGFPQSLQANAGIVP
jgi:hypothetical protein